MPDARPHRRPPVGADRRADPGGPKALFLGDVVPTAVHVKLPWVMAYDLDPARTVETKRALFTRALAEDWLLVWGHDKDHAGRPPGRRQGRRLRRPRAGRRSRAPRPAQREREVSGPATRRRTIPSASRRWGRRRRSARRSVRRGARSPRRARSRGPSVAGASLVSSSSISRLARPCPSSAARSRRAPLAAARPSPSTFTSARSADSSARDTCVPHTS